MRGEPSKGKIPDAEAMTARFIIMKKIFLLKEAIVLNVAMSTIVSILRDGSKRANNNEKHDEK